MHLLTMRSFVSLIELKHYLIQRKKVELMGLVKHFDREPELVRSMLSHWIRKGRVRNAGKPPGCGSRCTQCPSTFAEVYEWVG